MSEHLKRARTGAIVLVAICCIGLATPLILRSGATASYMIPTADEVAVGLHRVSLDPESLTAAGLSSNQVSGVVAAAIEDLTTSGALLDLAHDSHATAKRNRNQLVRRVRAGRATEQEIADCQTALTTLQNAESQLDAALNSLHAASADGLNANQLAVLAQIRQNRRWKLPMEFVTVSRTEQDWVDLRDALDNERQAARIGSARDAARRAFLTAARNNPTVSLARANLDANLALNAATWENAIENP